MVSMMIVSWFTGTALIQQWCNADFTMATLVFNDRLFTGHVPFTRTYPGAHLATSDRVPSTPRKGISTVRRSTDMSIGLVVQSTNGHQAMTKSGVLSLTVYYWHPCAHHLNGLHYETHQKIAPRPIPLSILA